MKLDNKDTKGAKLLPQNQSMMTRRDFIHSAAAVPTLATLPSLRAAAARPIKIGFLGCAHSHALSKFKVVRGSPDFELVGLAEESAAVREPFLSLGAKLVSREELLSGADVVVIESAVRDHARDAKAALAAGKHVHVEKPPAATMREMEEIVQLAREKKRLLQVGYMWRHNPGFNRAFAAVGKGWLGDVYLLRATMNTQIDARRRPEWAEFEGGAMFEQGCHLIDAAVRLLGKPTRVTPHLQRRGGDDLADNCVAVFEFPKAQAIITNSVLQPNAGPHRFLEILGSNGSVRVQPIEPPGFMIDLAKAAGPYKAGSQQVELPPYERYRDEFIELARAIREGSPLAVSLEEELNVQEALLSACQML
jgi:predicted dehydrogenase